jgi:hypothetical protein
MARFRLRVPLVVLACIIAAGVIAGALLLRDDSDDTAAPTAAQTPKPERTSPDTPRSPSPHDRRVRADEPRHERRDVPRVPALIGLTPDEVRNRLDPIGLETVFRTHCEGRPPLGRVIDQVPEPGKKPRVAHVSHGPQVTLLTDVASACSDGHTDSVCQSDDLTLEVDGVDAEYAGGGGRKSEYFEIKNRADWSCQLTTTATLTLSSLYETDGVVRGNPAMVVIDWKLQPKEIFRRQWIWNSWCEKPGQWNVAVSVAGLSATGKSHSPLCLEPGSLLYAGF